MSIPPPQHFLCHGGRIVSETQSQHPKQSLIGLFIGLIHEACSFCSFSVDISSFISRNLEFCEKILEFREKILVFRSKSFS